MSNKGVCEKMIEKDINGGVCKERRGTHECVYSQPQMACSQTFLEMFDAHMRVKCELYEVTH